MTKAQTRMTNQFSMTNDEHLGIEIWSFIGHSDLVIGHFGSYLKSVGFTPSMSSNLWFSPAIAQMNR